MNESPITNELHVAILGDRLSVYRIGVGLDQLPRSIERARFKAIERLLFTGMDRVFTPLRMRKARVRSKERALNWKWGE